MRIRSISAALAAVLTATIAWAAAPASAAEGVADFVSEPSLHPPILTVNTNRKGQAPGYIFTGIFQNKFLPPPLTGQGGPMVVDNSGRYVWLKPAATSAPDTLNVQVQRYQRRPVLTYWDGTVQNTGEMVGTWHVLNDHYKEIGKVPTGENGWDPSGHEFFITKTGTALVTGYKHIPGQDLSSAGGGPNQVLLDSGVLEYSIKTGKLVREWSAKDHIPMSEAQVRTSPQNPNAYDPWHINAIDIDADGNWLVSMRNTWAMYKVDSKTGQILWTLGGKGSTFTIPDNAKWAFQHDARFRPNGQISMFDNDCCGFIPQPSGPPKPAPPALGHPTRGLLLKLDETAKTATFVQQVALPYNPAITAGTQGNFQFLSNGNFFMGYGQQPFFAEFDKNGKLLLSVRYPDPDESYRAYRYQWVGRPITKPKAAALASGSRTRVYASWNGATQVAAWRVLGGKSSRRLAKAAKNTRRAGFETAITVSGKGPVFQVQALDARGRVLGTSKAVKRKPNTKGNEPAPVY